MRTGGHMMTVISLPFCLDIPCIPCIKLSFTTRNQNCKKNVASYLRLLQFEHVFLSNRARYLIWKLLEDNKKLILTLFTLLTMSYDDQMRQPAIRMT